MNRRSALLATLLGGGLIPARALGQQDDEEDRRTPPPRRGRPPARAVSNKTNGDDDFDAESDAPASKSGPADFRSEAGHAWRTYDISRYTELAYDAKNPKPQDRIVDWIFRRTGAAIWYGEKLAAISAGRAQLRVYHNPKVLKVVDEIVKQFTKSVADYLSVRVRFVAASDTRWRYLVHTKLKSLASGPQGQQIWTLRVEDAATVYAILQEYQNFRILADRRVRMINGQTLTVQTTEPIDYVVGPQRDGPVGLGMQPGNGQLDEGVTLSFSPLLTIDGDALDAAIDLKSNTVRRLVKTSILTRREAGPNDLTIGVPDATETRIEVPVKGWPIGQSLLLTGGITPGILAAKTGWFNMRIPGTVPTDTELLAFIDVERLDDAPSRSSRYRDE